MSIIQIMHIMLKSGKMVIGLPSLKNNWAITTTMKIWVDTVIDGAH